MSDNRNSQDSSPESKSTHIQTSTNHQPTSPSSAHFTEALSTQDQIDNSHAPSLILNSLLSMSEQIDPKYYVEALTNATDGLLMVDVTKPPAGEIVYASQGFLNLTGYTLNEVLGQSCSILQGDDTDSTTIAEIAHAMQNGLAYRGEILNYRKDGQPFWNLLRFTPVFNDAGEYKYCIGLQTDVTRKREMKYELKQHQKQLAHLTRLNIINEMVTGIAHQLNQPLTTIVQYAGGCVEHLQHGAGEETIAPILEEIVKQGEYAGNIIHHIKEFVKKGEIQKSCHNVNDIIQQTLELLSFKNKDVKDVVQLQLAEEPLFIEADKVQIEQVLLNIIDNAIDAMQESEINSPKIIIKTDQSDDKVCICVHDIGPGIDPTARDQIFEPFYTTKAHGLGMGLAICNSIINAHGGTVELITQNNHGSEFCIILPVKQ